MSITLRWYEPTNEEWNRIAPLLPPENTGKQGRPRKDNRTILNGMVWLACSDAPWRDQPERYSSWQTLYSRFRKWIDDGIPDNIFCTLSLEDKLEELSIHASIVKAHQHSTGAKKGHFQWNRTHSREGATAKIHAVVDAYGYPVYFIISERQLSDISYAIPLLEHVKMNENWMFADRGYDSNKPIPQRKQVSASLRLVALPRYDRLPSTYLGFYLVSILVWIKWTTEFLFQTGSKVLIYHSFWNLKIIRSHYSFPQCGLRSPT